MRDLRFQDVRRAVQALSSLYVERRERLGGGAALDGAGKRAAFAMYFSPLRFLLIREIVRELGVAPESLPAALDLGCGSGVAGAAWALEATGAVKIRGIDAHSWAVAEAQWTYRFFNIDGSARLGHVEGARIPPKTVVLAAFIINELSDEARRRTLVALLDAAGRGGAALVVEPIARRLTPWWDEWARLWLEAGGREDTWRFPVTLPEPLARMDKAAGLNHRELTGRSLWLGGEPKKRSAII